MYINTVTVGTILSSGRRLFNGDNGVWNHTKALHFGNADSRKDGAPQEIEIAAAHKYFAANCFNEAWALMEKTGRSEGENRRMVLLNQASIYHWRERKDCTAKSLSVGYWQASRIHSLLENAAEAVRFGNICLSYSGELEPFYLGYAHEALARAHQLSSDSQRATDHLTKSKDFAARASSQEERELLEADLHQFRSPN